MRIDRKVEENCLKVEMEEKVKVKVKVGKLYLHYLRATLRSTS